MNIKIKFKRYLSAGLCLAACSPFAFAEFGPRLPANPSLGLDGAASMHGDAASSDTTPLAGPGASGINSSYKALFAACSTILVRSDGRPMILCTAWLGRDPVIRILDKDNSAVLDKLKLSSSSLLGGVYAFIDNEDRFVMVDSDLNLIRVKAVSKKKLVRTVWTLSIDSSVSLASAVTGHCGGGTCDAVVSISAGVNGAVWFATKKSVVGIYHPSTGSVTSVQLASDEAIHNSFSTVGNGLAGVATDRALYLLQEDANGQLQVKWRKAYDAGSARKPGQLSAGTGATPTFFGPVTGTEYLMITDNADDLISLLVYDASAEAITSGKLVCEHRLFSEGASGTENSAIGIGNTVVVASTYGYPYPAVPEGAGPAVPASADFVGGMVRIDVRQDQTGCDLVWENSVRSSAVPKLSTADDLIYTIERKAAFGGNGTGALDSYHFTVIDPHTGAVLRQDKIGGTVFHNTLQTAGNADLNGVFWQGTLGGIIRIEAK